MNLINLFAGLFLLAATQVNAYASQDLWQPVPRANKAISTQVQSDRYYRSDNVKLRQILSRAGQQGGAELDTRIDLPLANGDIEQFQVVESPVMAPELAARFPEIKTYQITGIDNPYASGRLSMTYKGFTAMITTPTSTYYLDPASEDLYRGYSKNSSTASQPFKCGVKGHTHDSPVTTSLAQRVAARVPGSLRVYRLAVAAAAEYVAAVGGTKNLAMSEMVTTINRVNQIYQRDLGIKLELVADNDKIVFTSTATDPYPNPDLDISLLLQPNQDALDSIIGSAKYDVGHVFSTGGGGIAYVGSVCASGYKAQGATGLTGSSGDAFYIDYVAHEIGHQFGAEHTFNGTTSACSGGNRSATSAFEPGSGSTIMAYSGICGAENLQNNSDAVFHAGSLAQIHQYTTSGGGQNCGSLQSITNNPNQPTADAGNNYTIPAQTPFVLSAVASDADGDTLSYTWDEMDTGTATSAADNTFGLDFGDNALFRSYLPQAPSTRFFPRLDKVLSATVDPGEKLPTSSRSLNFTLTVRDGRSGLAQDNVTLTTVSTSAFFVTSDTSNASISDTSVARTVSWNVGNTDQSPISCALVNVDLLKLNSAKTSYCEERLVSNTANNGSVAVNLPDETIPVARFKVSCADNIFYAVSSGDLDITGATTADVGCNSVIPDNLEQTSEPIISAGTTSTGGGGSSGVLAIYSLLTLFLLAYTRRRFRL